MIEIDTIENLLGKIQNIHKNKKVKKCLTCGKRISVYNPNNYCFHHVISGRAKELERQYMARQARSRYISKLCSDRLKRKRLKLSKIRSLCAKKNKLHNHTKAKKT